MVKRSRDHVVLDSFAWIEYFSGTSLGSAVRDHVNNGHAFTPTIVLAELSEKYKRTGQDFAPRYDFIKSRSRLIQLDEELARNAGEINHDRKMTVRGWGMMDSIVLATGRRVGAPILTGDPHFKDLPEAIMIQSMNRK